MPETSVAQPSPLSDLMMGGPAPQPTSPLSDLYKSQLQTPLDRARQQYPILQNLDLGYTETPRNNSGYLEYWPQGEPGSQGRPRPDTLPMGKPGLEVFRSDVRPIDVLGDVVSHGLVNSDSKIGEYYRRFRDELTPDQIGTLNNQYEHAKQTFGEKRDFSQWAETSGLPAYFRGYAFQQWPHEANDKLYTPGQRQMFDEMMQYLKGR